MKALGILILICNSVALGRHAATPPQNPFAGQPAARLAGRKLYRHHCAVCHGPDAAVPRQSSEEELFRILRNGNLPRGMPSWSHLPEQQRWQIITYVKSLP